jgi:hypothetical protein
LLPDVWLIVTENFNTREIAGTIWLLVIFLFGLLKAKDMRQSLAHVYRAILAPRLLVVFGYFSGCVALLAWIGNSLGFWSSSQTIPTIVWYFIGGLPLLVKANDAEEGSQHFRGYAKAAVGGTALFGFIYGAKTFSLPVELALTPVVTVIAMLAAFSERDPEHAPVNTLMNWLLAAVVIAIFWNSISQILDAPKEFFTTRTLQAFILPIYFTIGSIPFFYAIHCYSHIGVVRRQIDQKTFQSDELKRYAKKRFILTFLARPWLLQRAKRQLHIRHSKEKSDVDEIIDDILQYEREEENPPEVDEKLGWSPFLAREFLSAEDLRTSDYHATYEDEWWSGLSSRELGEALGINTVSYSFVGVKGLVQKLKLEGRFLKEFATEEVLKEFGVIAGKLCEQALNDGDDELRQLLRKLESFKRNHNGTCIRLRRERFPDERGFELILEFERPVGPGKS